MMHVYPICVRFQKSAMNNTTRLHTLLFEISVAMNIICGCGALAVERGIGGGDGGGGGGRSGRRVNGLSARLALRNVQCKIKARTTRRIFAELFRVRPDPAPKSLTTTLASQQSQRRMPSSRLFLYLDLKTTN